MIKSSEKAISLSKTYNQVFPGVGIHPNELNRGFSEEMSNRILELASLDDVVMMSEIGLDFMENSPDRAIQYKAFYVQFAYILHLSNAMMVIHLCLLFIT